MPPSPSRARCAPDRVAFIGRGALARTGERHTSRVHPVHAGTALKLHVTQTRLAIEVRAVVIVAYLDLDDRATL